MEGRLDSMEKGISEIKESVEQMRIALEKLTTRDAQRGAFEKAGMWFAGLIGAAIAIVAGHFWK